MIVAADFVRSAKARDSEFTTNKGILFKKPLPCQNVLCGDKPNWPSE